MKPQVKPKSTMALRAKAACPFHSLSNLVDLKFVVDAPTERGGANLGPTPTDMACSTLVGCSRVIANRYAKSFGVDIGDFSFEATSELIVAP